MSQYLSIGGYKWEYTEDFLSDPNNNKQALNSILSKRENASCGCFVQIKAHFPQKTHDYLTDLLPAVKNIKVKREQFSPKQKRLIEKLGKDYAVKYISSEKLVTNFQPKENYVIHY